MSHPLNFLGLICCVKSSDESEGVMEGEIFDRESGRWKEKGFPGCVSPEIGKLATPGQ